MRVLKVQGKGHASVEPDLVTLAFNVETKARDYADCLRMLHARTSDLRASMTAAGIERTELKTSSFGVQAETKYAGGQHTFVGYCASHRLSIELPMDKEQLNKAFQQIALGHSGAEISLSFSVKDKDGLRKRVLKDAVRSAKRNAETLAAAAGMKLGKLQQIDYGWAEVRIYEQSANMVCESAAMPAPPAADIEPEDVRAEDNVTLVYEIVD